MEKKFQFDGCILKSNDKYEILPSEKNFFFNKILNYSKY